MSHQNSPNRLFSIYIFILLFIVGVVFTFLVPPFQKPDEESHFNRTLALSQGVLSCSKGKTVIKIPEQYYAMTAFIKSYEMPLHPEHKLPSFISQIYLYSNKKADPIEMDVSAVCNFPIISYLPSLAGIFIGMSMGLNPYITFFLGRLILFITCFIWLIYLYRKTRYKSILVFVASIPMFLHQVSAYGYDGVTFMLTLTLFVMITGLMHKERISIRDYVALFTVSIIYLLNRSGGHELLLLFILLIPSQNIHAKKHRYIFYLFVLYTTIFGLYAATKFHAVTSFIGNGLPEGADPAKQIQFILNHPLQLILVMIKTTISRSIFYLQSMTGILGWLEYGIPHWMYAAYAAIGGWLVANGYNTKERRWTWYQIIAGFFVILINYVYILSIFYVVWTPVGAPVVNGVQGRYFLTLLPFVLLIAKGLANRFNIHHSLQNKYFIWIMIILSFSMTVGVIRTVLLRYYMM